MKRNILVLTLFCFISLNPIITYAKNSDSNPIRNIVNFLDHWYRSGFTLEEHIRYECEAYEASKIPEGKKKLINFKIDRITGSNNLFEVHAAYLLNGMCRDVTAHISKRNGIWVNQSFEINYLDSN